MIGRRCVLCDTLFAEAHGVTEGTIPVCPDCRQELVDQNPDTNGRTKGMTAEEYFIELNR